MNNNISIPYNDVFFYGLTMRARDISDVREDIFSNILMRYLTSLKPVSNRLYRVSGNAKFEYSYSFVPTKPISWRVIKNRRVIEDVEKMSDGKYCLNYYDDNGCDVKRVIYNNQHKWVKTNYYNSVYGEALVCSLVPKEINGETAILQYITGDPYPVTLFSCPVASNQEVLEKVLSRVPEPEVTALTNYGILYFACEETHKLYKQILEEEERKYLEAHKPQVYNTEEDVAGGFCFDVNSFDSTKNFDSSFDLQSVDELTEEGFVVSESASVESEDSFVVNVVFDESEISSQKVIKDTEEYSVDKEIADAIRVIAENTKINIDEALVFEQDEQENDITFVEPVLPNVSLVEDIHYENIDLVFEDSFVSLGDDNEQKVNVEVASVESEKVNNEEIVDDSAIIEEIKTEALNDANDSIELLNMDDDAIDDYVSNLIDSILLDAKSTAREYMIDKGEAFSETETLSVEDVIVNSENYVTENTPDLTIESNGLDYFYYGCVDSDNKRSGRGKTLMSDGKTAYEGDYLNDQRDGIGSFYFKDGSLCYWGQWEKNNRNGFGIGISSETGIAHIGSWENNKPVGIGARFDKDGNFMYLDSACHNINGGIRVTGFTDSSLFVEVWDEKTLKIIKKEIFLEDLF